MSADHVDLFANRDQPQEGFERPHRVTLMQRMAHELYALGFSQREIGQKFGVGRTAITMRLARRRAATGEPRPAPSRRSIRTLQLSLFSSSFI